VVLLALALIAAPAHAPQLESSRERQTLVVTDSSVIAHRHYANEASCKRARNVVFRKWRLQHPGVVLANQSAICIPRH
jgi:hypothetical protein